MKPPVALLENMMDFFNIQLKGAGNRFRGLSFVMSLTKNVPVYIGPLPENAKDILDKIFPLYFKDARPHFGPPLLSFHMFR